MKAVLLGILTVAAIVLMLTFGWFWILILPIGLAVGVVWWLVALVSQGQTPGSSLRRVRHAELLGPGGPDDPDAARR